MRTKNTLKNIIIALILELLQMVCSLIFPRLIIMTYGSTVNGLTAAINNILSIINMLQAGAIGAATYEMFKPIKENDYKKVSTILDSSIRYFRKLGFIYLILVVAFIPYLVWKQQSSGLGSTNIAMSMVILGLHGSFSFFFYAGKDIIFSAHQKVRVMTIGSIVEKASYYLLLYFVLTANLHFTFMYIALLVSGIFKVMFLYIMFRREYGKKLPEVEKPNLYKVKSTNHMLANQLSLSAVNSSTTFIISAVSLALASVYSVYAFIGNVVLTALSTLQSSLFPSVGSLVAEGDDKQTGDRFKLIQYTFTIFGIFIFTCIGILYLPFMKLYTNGIDDSVNYMVPALALTILINSMAYCVYMPINIISQAYGLFQKTVKQMVITAIAAIGISILCCKIFGMPYVLVGNALFFIVGSIFRVGLLKKYHPNLKLTYLPKRITAMVVIPLVAFLLSSSVKLEAICSSWFEWIAYGFVSAFISICIIAIYSYLLERGEWKNLIEYAKRALNRRSNKHEV